MAKEGLKFFNPLAEIQKSGGALPHWQQPSATYFLTFRLADSIPAKLRDQWQRERSAWLEHHPEPWNAEVEHEYHQRFTQAMERWLDAGHGSCLLRDGNVRSIVEECLLKFDAERYVHHAWVIMPNHVHVLASLHPGWELARVLHTWKSFTCHAINRRLQREGPMWQADYFDRLIRDETHFSNCVRYIRRNPEKANLRPSDWSHHETDLAWRWL